MTTPTHLHSYVAVDLPLDERLQQVKAWVEVEFEGEPPAYFITLHSVHPQPLDWWRELFTRMVRSAWKHWGAIKALGFPSVNNGKSTQLHLHLLLTIPGLEQLPTQQFLHTMMGKQANNLPFIEPYQPTRPGADYSFRQVVEEGPWWGRAVEQRTRGVGPTRNEARRVLPFTPAEKAEASRMNAAGRHAKEITAHRANRDQRLIRRRGKQAVTQPMVPVRVTMRGLGPLAIRLVGRHASATHGVLGTALGTLLETGRPQGDLRLEQKHVIGVGCTLAEHWLVAGDLGDRRRNTTQLLRCSGDPFPLRLLFNEATCRPSRVDVDGITLALDGWYAELDLLVAVTDPSDAVSLARRALEARARLHGLSAVLYGAGDARGRCHITAVAPNGPAEYERRHASRGRGRRRAKLTRDRQVQRVDGATVPA